jgi:hypothetical protein
VIPRRPGAIRAGIGAESGLTLANSRKRLRALGMLASFAELFLRYALAWTEAQAHGDFGGLRGVMGP